LKARTLESCSGSEVKKFLFGAIFSWGAEDGSGGGKAEAKPKVNTRGWRIRGSEVPEVLEELRALLNGSGAHISDLANIFDEDAGSILSIDEVEFSKQLRRWCVSAQRGCLSPPCTLHSLAVVRCQPLACFIASVCTVRTPRV
jgi:hypothetical protein